MSYSNGRHKAGARTQMNGAAAQRRRHSEDYRLDAEHRSISMESGHSLGCAIALAQFGKTSIQDKVATLASSVGASIRSR
jgi:hypothetical protein